MSYSLVSMLAQSNDLVSERRQYWSQTINKICVFLRIKPQNQLL